MKNRLSILLLAVLSAVSFRSTAQLGIITTIAGNGTPGFSGDGGPATAAQFSYMSDVIVDYLGNVLVADEANSEIRKIDRSGIVSRLAGGTHGFGGDGGPATAASLYLPSGIAMDHAGNLYIADGGNNVIRKVDLTGIITTIAGIAGSPGYSGDGGPASVAKFVQPSDLRFDAIGNLFITDVGNNTVRKINTAGIITTFAGNGSAGYSGDGGSATAAQLNYPFGLMFDFHGNVLIADRQNHVVRRVNSSGVISTFAGNGYGASTSGYGGYSGDGGPATNGELSSPSAVAIDVTGNVYVTEEDNNVVRKVDTLGIISTVVGNGYGARLGYGGYSGDGGPAAACELSFPVNLAFDTAQNLYIIDGINYRIRKVSVSPTQTTNVRCSTISASIAPNPNNGIFTIYGSFNPEQLLSIDIVNVFGEIIYKSSFLTRIGMTNYEVKLPNGISAGVYYLSIKSNTDRTVFNLVINK